MLIVICDGLKDLAEAITTTRERTVVRQCILDLIRNSFRYAGRQHRDCIVKALKPAYTATSEQAAKDRFAEFVPFPECDVEIRLVICTMNAFESINARYRRAGRACGHFPK